MGDMRTKRLSRELQSHDSMLYAQETRPGRLDVYRKSSLGCNPPHFIFSLTDDWTPTGRPVEWGIEVVINRIKAHDLWRDDSYVDSVIRENERSIERRERDYKNSVESFLWEFRSQFAKATDGVNTGTLSKTLPKGNY